MPTFRDVRVPVLSALAACLSLLLSGCSTAILQPTPLSSISGAGSGFSGTSFSGGKMNGAVTAMLGLAAPTVTPVALALKNHTIGTPP